MLEANRALAVVAALQQDTSPSPAGEEGQARGRRSRGRGRGGVEKAGDATRTSGSEQDGDAEDGIDGEVAARWEQGSCHGQDRQRERLCARRMRRAGTDEATRAGRGGARPA